MKRKLLGVVGVDSGQLLITDPCYIDGHWKKENFIDIRLHKHKKTGKLFMFNSPFKGKTQIKAEMFDNYESKTSTGKSVNQMNEAGELEEINHPAKKGMIGKYSYGGICETISNDEHQLYYPLGHEGIGVAFSSGLGDGVYNVYGWFYEGRCFKVEIDCGITDAQAVFIKSLSCQKKKRKNTK